MLDLLDALQKTIKYMAFLIGTGAMAVSVFTHNHHLSALGAVLMLSAKDN